MKDIVSCQNLSAVSWYQSHKLHSHYSSSHPNLVVSSLKPPFIAIPMTEDSNSSGPFPYHTVIMSCGNTPSTALVSVNAATQLPLKLTGSSIYPSWRTMFSTLLYGYDLIGYVDGTYPCPPEMIKMGDTFTPNPEHKIWKRQDSLLLHAIRESVDSTIAPLVASTTFAQESWARLHTTYASKSKTRILGLREMLSQLIKENKSVVDYMTVIKTMSDEFAIVRSPLGEEEMVISVLKGLGSEFKELSATIRA